MKYSISDRTCGPAPWLASLAFISLGVLPVHATEVALTPAWNLFDPEGNSSLSEQSSTGFTATISDLSDVANGALRPAITQEFEAIDLTEIGSSVRARFDVGLLNDIIDSNDTDFRFSFYDSATNFEIIVGMVDLGIPSGTAMRIRIDDHVSTLDEENPPGDFIPGDYSHFGQGGGTLSPGGISPGIPGLQYTTDVSSFETTVTRISATELEITTTWSVQPEFGDKTTATATVIHDESNPNNPDDVPPGGRFTQVNGFGFRMDDGNPFNTDGSDETIESGSYTVSNLTIDYSQVVPLASTWTLFDPEGNSSLSEQSDSGFVAEIHDVVDGAAIPVVLQEFDPLAISQVGQSIEVSFAVTPLTELFDANDTDFRFGLFDTSTNFELILGMIDLGPPEGTGMRIRIDENISTPDEENPPGSFTPGDYADFGNGGGTLSPGGPSAGVPGLQIPELTNRLMTKVTRTSATELQFYTTWIVEDFVHVSDTATAILNEANPANPDDVPPSGNFEQMNGFGFRLLDLDPFNDPFDDFIVSGQYRISDFQIRHCAGPVVVEGSIRVISLTTDPESGDIMITWEAENGVSYDVFKSLDLENFGASPVATVQASGDTASYTIPAAEVATDSTAFFQISSE